MHINSTYYRKTRFNTESGRVPIYQVRAGAIAISTDEYISDDDIFVFWLFHRIMSNAKELVRFSISKNWMKGDKAIEAGAFDACEKLFSINLSSNKLTTLPPSIGT